MLKIKDNISGSFDLFFGKREEEDGTQNDLEKYQRKVQRQKHARVIGTVTVLVLALILAFVVKYFIDHRVYDGYRVIETSEQMDSSILQYEEMGSYVLKYSGDGVSLLDASDEVQWTDSIQMTTPLAESFEDAAAVYEVRGTTIHIYGIKGKLGTIKTDYPILKVSVSGKGGVAVLLEKSDSIWMNYYSYTGTLIASSTSNMKNPGYPVDLSLSKDGMSLAITYFVAEEDCISSYLAFYNFGDIGKEKEDNLVDGDRFKGILVPEVQYLDDETLVVYREDGFSLYRGTGIVENVKNVVFEKEIISCFQSDELFGFVLAEGEQGEAFELRLYNRTGRLEMDKSFDFMYDEVKISENQIILFNESQLAVIGKNGVEHFCGNFEEGTILDVVKKSMNRYDVACSKGVVTIVLE